MHLCNLWLAVDVGPPRPLDILTRTLTRTSDGLSITMSPPMHHPGSNAPKCRFSKCDTPVFFDIRTDEYREWCSDDHMMLAIRRRVEVPCKTCHVWPCRKGYEFCSGDVCKYPSCLIERSPAYKLCTPMTAPRPHYDAN
ncbi:hypothetical protein BGY98DRAFT_965710 [Russula aff. rugulosa BPL654]|nr:hypothetical protein BGY98DRAFT_965710 [Russula aff. rugulosa BPL654]